MLVSACRTHERADASEAIRRNKPETLGVKGLEDESNYLKMLFLTRYLPKKGASTQPESELMPASASLKASPPGND